MITRVENSICFTYPMMYNIHLYKQNKWRQHQRRQILVIFEFNNQILLFYLSVPFNNSSTSILDPSRTWYEIMHQRKRKRPETESVNRRFAKERERCYLVLVIIYTSCLRGIHVGFKYSSCSSCARSCEQFSWRCGACARDTPNRKSHSDATNLGWSSRM